MQVVFLRVRIMALFKHEAQRDTPFCGWVVYMIRSEQPVDSSSGVPHNWESLLYCVFYFILYT